MLFRGIPPRAPALEQPRWGVPLITSRIIYEISKVSGRDSCSSYYFKLEEETLLPSPNTRTRRGGRKMPGLVRKLIIFAAVDGLVLQSSGSGSGGGRRNSSNGNNFASIHIEYNTRKISPLAQSRPESTARLTPNVEAYGLVGT